MTKSEVVQVRLTEEGKELLRSEAAKAGVSISKYILQAISERRHRDSVQLDQPDPRKK